MTIIWEVFYCGIQPSVGDLPLFLMSQLFVILELFLEMEECNYQYRITERFRWKVPSPTGRHTASLFPSWWGSCLHSVLKQLTVAEDSRSGVCAPKIRSKITDVQIYIALICNWSMYLFIHCPRRSSWEFLNLASSDQLAPLASTAQRALNKEVTIMVPKGPWVGKSLAVWLQVSSTHLAMNSSPRSHWFIAMFTKMGGT